MQTLGTAKESPVRTENLTIAVPSEEELRERLRRWLRYLVDKPNSNQKALADALGMSQAHVSNLYNGKADPGLDFLVRLHFGTGAGWEVVREDPPLKK